MFVLYAGALFILPLKLQPIIKFGSIVIFTFLGCFVIYEFVVKKIIFLRPLFGLKLKNKTSKKVEIVSTSM
jgi:hypothetical protein